MQFNLKLCKRNVKKFPANFAATIEYPVYPAQSNCDFVVDYNLPAGPTGDDGPTGPVEEDIGLTGPTGPVEEDIGLTGPTGPVEEDIGPFKKPL